VDGRNSFSLQYQSAVVYRH